jgi:hypothetical protein
VKKTRGGKSCDTVPLSGFTEKPTFQCTFDGNLSVTCFFIKQIFQAAEEVTPYTLPPQCCAGGGVVVALFSPKL